MVTVTQESLAARIAELEAGPRSLKEDFALEAYRMLLPFVTRIETQSLCAHDWWIEPGSEGRSTICLKCGKRGFHG